MKTLLKFLIVILTITTISCRETKDSTDQKLPAEFIIKHKTKVSQPSGLALSYDKKALWTVSDSKNKAYLLSFDGEILESLQLDGVDPEGITIIDDTTIGVVFERERILALYNTSGSELKRKMFDEFKGKINSGFEGVTYDPVKGHFFIVNEKRPSLLIEINSEFEVIAETELTDAIDYSGIFYDQNKEQLWLISDEDKMIAQYDLNGKLIESFRVTAPQIEGIAVDHDRKRIYVISDITGELFIYKIIE